MKVFIKKINNCERGVATLEMLIAMTLLVMTVSAVISLVFSDQGVSVSSQTNQEALYKAEQAIEEARSKLRTNFYDPSLSPGSTITTDVSGVTYTKNLTVSNIDDYTKKITSLVSWGGAGSYIQLSTIATDWQSIYGADTCSPTVSGDWTAPQVYGYVDFSSPTGATGVDTVGTKSYITSDPSSSGTDDFYVVDVSDPNLKPLPILGSISTSYGLTDVYTVGTHSYVSAHSASYQLLTIDVSDPTNLNTSNIISKKDVTIASDTAYGNTIAYANKKIYLGLTLSLGPELHIFCVGPDASIPACAGSSTSNPIEVGTGFEVGSAVNHILVKNNIAYITTASSDEAIALDVSDPANIKKLSAYNSASLTGQSLALDTTNNTLYFGRIGGIGNPKLMSLDSNDLSSSPKWTMDMIKQSGVYTLILRGNLLFMTTADPSDGLQIWNVTNKTAPPTRFDTTPLNIQQGATAGTDCAGNLIYVAQRSNRAMQIVGPYVAVVPPFTYTLNNVSDITITRGGASKVVSMVVTMASGAVPQTVTLTPTNPAPADITITPVTANCTPNVSSPYTCTVTLSYKASATATKKTYNNQVINGTPNSVQTNKFKITVN